MKKVFIERLVPLLNEEGMDAILVCPSEELKFLIGFSPMMCERFQGLFIKNDGSLFYICNLLYAGELEHELSGLEIFTWFDGDVMADTVSGILEREGLTGKKVGVNSTAPAFCILEIAKKSGITFVNAKPYLEEIRIIKQEEDLENLRISASIADKAFDAVVKFIKPGLKEADIKSFLFSEMEKHGGTKPWALVATGPNSSFPHYLGTDRVVETKDVVLLDFG